MKVLGNGYVNLIDVMGDDLRIVNAARKSFGNKTETFGTKEKKLLKYLWDNQHTSPFEMVEFMFEVKAPLFVVRQWQRHRTWSYNEVSRRYTSEDLDFYIPLDVRRQSKDNKQASTPDDQIGICPYTNMTFAAQVQDHVNKSVELYNEWIERDLCREQARMVLPQNMMVEFVAKVDLSNLIKFLKLRNHEHAQWEIQEYARAIEKLIAEHVPHTMELYFNDSLYNLLKDNL